MQEKLLQETKRYSRQNRRRGIWKKIVGSLACIVVFCTTYALILPAITLEKTPACGMAEHIHTENCYVQVTSESIAELNCTYESLGVHSHTQECVDTEGILVCGNADYVVHTHDPACFDESGLLICQLPEVKEHRHTEECYQELSGEPHVHDEACYTLEQGDLICELAETEGHSHSDSCYIQGQSLVCGLEETEGHIHGEECSKSVLICTETDVQHIHNENCYEIQVTCTVPESESHTHTSECYEQVLDCGLTEEQAHWHTEDCYEQNSVLVCEETEEAESAEPVLICTEPEVTLHSHTEQCYEKIADEDGTERENLICTELVVTEHTHGEECFVSAEIPVDTQCLTCQLDESEAHTHTAMCYGTWELVCELPEHTHTEECQAASELTEEELAQVETVIAQIDTLETADQVEAKLAELEAAEDWDGYLAYQEEAARKTQTVRESYQALSDAQKQKVTNAAKLTQLDWLVPSAALDGDDNKGSILESLAGDWAYITNFIMKEDASTESKTYVRTGTSPWDDDDEAGNDSTELNNILRTFDTATYTIQFNTTLRDAKAQEDVGGIKQGRLYFEFVLPLSAEEVQFETDAMGWLKSSQDIKYEVVTATVNGVESQVLRGSFTLVPTGSNDAAIGASTNELSVVIRALKMQNGEKIKPIFTLWLEHNEVGVTYDAEDSRLPETIVTGTNHICGAEVTKKDTTVEKHDQCEAATLTGPEITVSARPMFNIGMNGVNSNNTTVGTFNFNAVSSSVSGIDAEDLINYGQGEVYGRMNGYGIRLEVRGKSGQGLRGAEFPDEDTPIEIDLTVTSSYWVTGETKSKVVSEYQALFWSGDANASRGTTGLYNNDGRDLYTTKGYIHSTLPYNYTKSGEEYKRCYNGGKWSFSLNEDGTVHAIITDFEFNTSSISNFPYSYTSGTKTTYQFYNPNEVQNYWEIEQAVFSTGELWLVQPYYDADGNYIAEKYGGGQFYTKVQVTDLYYKAESGSVIDTVQGQTKTADDTIDNGQYLKTPGGIDGRVIYSQGETTSLTAPLTDGAQQEDYDWATAGTEITLTSWIFHSKAEAEYVGVAYDNLIKFDDEFFQPDLEVEGAEANGDNYKISGRKDGQRGTVLWAAKPDGTGWVDDEEMKQATQDDLVYYSTVRELIADGKTPIGVLFEVRGVGLESGENQLILYVDGVVKSDCVPNQVYMVTRTSYAWCKQDVAEAALAYHNEKHPDDPYESSDSLSKAEWNEYLKDTTDGFPSRVQNTKKLLTDDHDVDTTYYPSPFWRQDYYYTSARSSGGSSNNVGTDGTIKADAVSALKEAAKATYPNGVYQPGVGAYYYQDSCLVIPYDLTITKSTAQSEKGSEVAKTVYDMGQNQRTVDYVLKPGIHFAESDMGDSDTAAMTTTVYIEDTLPASLTYIPGSAYYGGTYTQDQSHQSQGACTGKPFVSTLDAGTNVPSGTYPYLETVTYNDDGTTTIRWIFNVSMAENVVSWTENIYFSCSVGTPGVEATDVKNGDSIINTVKIWTSDNNTRPFSADYGNLDTFSITILKTSAVSLSKISDYLVMDWWDDFGFTMNVGNNSGSEKTGTIIVETLPFNSLYRSDFTGQLVVKEFSAAIVDADGDLTDSNFTFYYTTSSAYAGWLSSDYSEAMEAAGYSTMAEWIAAQNTSGAVWTELTMSGTAAAVNGMSLYPASNLPSTDTQKGWTGQQITSIVAVGNLPAGSTMKMHVTLNLPQGTQGDYMVNYLSQGNLSSYARAQAVNRSLEGYTWLDWDADGIQDSGEEPVEVWAVLYKLDESTGKYEQYRFQGDSTKQVVCVKTGQQISVMGEKRSDAVSYDTGRYKFTDLPAGTYKVLFKSETTTGKSAFDMTTFLASPQNAGDDDTVDSDAAPYYNASGKLNNTYIEGIVMKEAKELVYGMDESKYHDSGFYYRRFDLPQTGGTGTTLYAVAGLVLTLFSGAYLLYRRGKRRREVA